jgi:hypothetical protein
MNDAWRPAVLSMIVLTACDLGPAGSPGPETEGWTPLVAPSEPYPVQMIPAGDAEEVAQERLDDLAGEAGSSPVMYWSDPRGTFTAVYGLSYPLAGCPSTGAAEDVSIDPKVEDAAWQLFGDAHGLFHLRRSEWRDLVSVRCADVGATPVSLLMTRATLGGQTEEQDVAIYIVLRVDGVVKLVSISGDFLPPAPAAVATAMASFPPLDPAVAEEIAFASEYGYSIFDHCFYVGSGTYLPQPGDTFTLEDAADAFWRWEDAATGDRVVLTKRQRGYLIVHRDHWTPELINSDAFCGDTIGWTIELDAVSGKVWQITPGIGCVVC